MAISGWTTPLRLLQAEIIQLKESGHIVPAATEETIAALAANAKTVADEWAPEIEEIYKSLDNLPVRADWKYQEPDEWDEIRKLCPNNYTLPPMTLSEDELKAKYLGAWRGRATGCALGKPVENFPRAKITNILKEQGEWELNDFFKSYPGLYCPRSQRENIKFMESDDDINYPFIGLLTMEAKGKDFAWNDVANSWNSYLPYNQICTAETQAILNYNLQLSRCDGGIATAQFTRNHFNPYREWIGAAIRADFWAYAAAGKPELAAEFAYRDACWTHTGNGIYAEMFIAAIIAGAFLESDPYKLVEIGLSQIPSTSRLAEAVRNALVWRKECQTWEGFMDRLDETFNGMSFVHAINNMVIVVMALLYGDTTIDRNTALSVMAGYDTDCNGATVGSITGIINPESKLALRLNETIQPGVVGESICKMSDLAERTLAVWKKIQ